MAKLGDCLNDKFYRVKSYHTDHLGSSSVITDDDGAGEEVVQEIYYYPYGETKTNTTPPGANVNVTYKFTGKELDGETGLYYYGARYYDPMLARFISADTIVPKPFYPISLNRYAYAYNNPIGVINLDGHYGSIMITVQMVGAGAWSHIITSA